MRYFPCILFLALILILSSASASEIYATRGDAANTFLKSTKENLAISSCWYFPTTGLPDSKLYDIPPVKNEDMYVCQLTGDLTKDMPEGRYTLVYEISPVFNNKVFKDISWKDGSLISIFSESKPVNERGNQAQWIMQDLISKIKSNEFGFYDQQEVIIQEPELKISELGKVQTEDFERYRIAGTSNLPNNTLITIKIDEDRYFAQHNDSFTFTTRLLRDPTHPSSPWSYDMPVSVNDMPAGWHDINVYGKSLITTVKFKIDMGIVPTPTPTVYVKYLSNGDIAPEIVNVTVIQTQYIDRWHTATPTPAITDALGGEISYPYKAGGQTPGWIGLLAATGIAALVLVRDWKWKK